MTIQTKSEIIIALRDSNQHIHDWFSAIPTSDYFARQGEVWSAFDNVDHVIKAVKPIVQALGLPHLALHTMFGKPKQASRSYDEICKIYSDEIAKGAQASGRFLPGYAPVEDKEQARALQLQKVSKVIENLLSALEKWEDTALDQCQLPHPIIGNLTMREMLFFTIHHNLRHASHEGD